MRFHLDKKFSGAFLKRAAKGTLAVFLFLILLIALPYGLIPVYHFPEMAPFSGPSWYNPYEAVHGSWFKSNFHAHSKSWMGMTSGKNTVQEIHGRYREIGYDIIGISNYQSIMVDSGGSVEAIGVYEHGYNVWKRHHLVIGARHVMWFDFLLWQGVHEKQWILNLFPEEAFVALAHPDWYGGFSTKDVGTLTGYDAVEVLNPYRNSGRLWDEALSAGKPVWIIGSDDSHDIGNPQQTGRFWNMINAPSAGRHDILDALHAGRYYAVAGNNGLLDAALLSVVVIHDSLSISCSTVVNEILFFGQGAREKARYTDVRNASVPLLKSDTYIRAEIRTPSCRFYLNPVIRCEGMLSSYQARPDPLRTGLKIAAVLCVAALYVLLMRRLFHTQKENHEYE